LVILDSSGKIESQFALRAYDARWSPDGQHIAFWDFEWKVGILETETEKQTVLFAGQVPYLAPILSWSPDGQNLAFIAQLHKDSPWGLYVVDVRGSADPRVVWTCDHKCRNPHWTADGSHIIVSEELPIMNMHLLARVVKVDIRTASSTVLFVVNRDIDVMKWSPDETRVAMSSLGDGLFLRDNGNGTEKRILAHRVSSWGWSPDGKWLAFTQVVGDPMFPREAVNVYDIGTGKIYRLYPKGSFLFEGALGESMCILDWHK